MSTDLFVQDPKRLREQLASKPDVNKLNYAGETVLFEAARFVVPESVQMLLDAGADATIRATNGNNVLHELFSYRREEGPKTIELFRLLVSKGADPNALDKEGRLPLARAIGAWQWQFSCPPVVALAELCDVNVRAPRKPTLLHLAVESIMPDAVRALLARGAKIDALSKSAQLMLAAFTDDLPGAKKLLSSGVKPDSFKGLGQKGEWYGFWRPMSVAAKYGSFEMVELLLDHGANPNEGYPGDRPITHVVERGNLELTKRLLAAGADDQGRTTALCGAVKQGNVPLFELALPLVSKDDLKYAIAVACTAGRMSLLERLVAAAGGTVAVADTDGRWNYLSWDALFEQNRVEVVQFLIAHGAKLDRRDDKGRGLLERAQLAGRNEIVALLEKAGAPKPGDRTAEVLARWRARLEKEKQPWPEWRELQERASKPGWKLQINNGRDYLVAADGKLSIRVLEEHEHTEPSWLAPLVRLAPRSDLNIAGSLAKFHDWGPINRDLVPDAEGVPIPHGVRALQSTAGGTAIGINAKGNVVGFTGQGWPSTGTLEAFMRYCLRRTLDGEAWSDGYQSSPLLATYGLTPINFLE
jgi:ankyrin repeat protein